MSLEKLPVLWGLDVKHKAGSVGCSSCAPQRPESLIGHFYNLHHTLVQYPIEKKGKKTALLAIITGSLCQQNHARGFYVYTF